MTMPVWIKPAGWGAVFGAVAIMIVGFSWMGWNLGNTTKRLVAEGSESAVIAALTPLCLANYMNQPQGSQQLALPREDNSPFIQRHNNQKVRHATTTTHTV